MGTIEDNRQCCYYNHLCRQYLVLGVLPEGPTCAVVVLLFALFWRKSKFLTRLLNDESGSDEVTAFIIGADRLHFCVMSIHLGVDSCSINFMFFMFYSIAGDCFPAR